MTTNTILHGSSVELAPNIEGPIHAIITDPPYGMAFQSNQTTRPESKQYVRAIEDDDDPVQAIFTFHAIMRNLIWKLAPQAEIYIFTAWHVLEDWMPQVRDLEGWLLCECGHYKGVHHRPMGCEHCACQVPYKKLDTINLEMMLIWAKGDPGMGDLECNWGCGYEVILYLKRGRKKLNGKRRPGIITIDRVPSGKNIHPTEKPVSLIEQLIERSTEPGDLIVDPYSGSGSTSVAAQRLGRNSIGIELDAAYVERSRQRLQQQGFAFD